MIPRYADPRIDTLFSNEAKVGRWQRVEMAVIDAAERSGRMPIGTHGAMEEALVANPCDIDWWLTREKVTHHDLAAWIDERLRHIPTNLHPYWHKDMTSYDTEDAAFSLALLNATAIVSEELSVLLAILRTQAGMHRNTVMLERTHGQGAKLRSFGGRILTWLAPLVFVEEHLKIARSACQYSRISGAIGNFGGGLTPEGEEAALKILGLKPFAGATQILPRVVHAPLVNALRMVAEELGRMAMDFRLGARSGKPLWHEPFGKGQKGSSAMPHKKNPINTEQMEGMLALVRGSANSILDSIQTWEARAINQSCVERVAWPDLFHEVLRMLSVMTRVMDGMVVYPDHMIQEIQDACGTYASDEAKNFLADECGKRDVPFEIAYRIIQLASWNALSPTEHWARIRQAPPSSLLDIDAIVWMHMPAQDDIRSIRDVIADRALSAHPELDAPEAQVIEWNMLLGEIFRQEVVRKTWAELFNPSFLLRSEDHLFNMLGIA